MKADSSEISRRWRQSRRVCTQSEKLTPTPVFHLLLLDFRVMSNRRSSTPRICEHLRTLSKPPHPASNFAGDFYLLGSCSFPSGTSGYPNLDQTSCLQLSIFCAFSLFVDEGAGREKGDCCPGLNRPTNRDRNIWVSLGVLEASRQQHLNITQTDCSAAPYNHPLIVAN